MNETTAADQPIHLSAAFPGERIDWETYSKISEHLSNPRVIVTLIPGRCGSTFFAGIVRGTGLCGTGEEVFNEITVEQWHRAGSTLAQAFERCLRRGLAGGVCWIQMAPDRYESLTQIVDPRILRGWRYSILLRRDIISQAISYLYAMHSGVWHSIQGRIESEINLTQEEAAKAVLNWIGRLETIENKIRMSIRRFAGPSYLVQLYEDIVASPREETLRFLRFYGIKYDMSELRFDGGEMVQRLTKTGDIELYDECCRRVPWLQQLVSERKRISIGW